MYTLKGFIGIESLISNEPGVVAPVGELSPHSRTYSKEIGLHSTPTNTDLTFYSFSSKYSATGHSAVPEEILSNVFAFADWVLTGQFLPGAPISRTVFLNNFIAQFGSQATSIGCGPLVNVTGDVWFPEWITWRLTALADDHPADENTITIWFSDYAFNHQYDEFSITVVPPLETIDAFFGTRTAIVAALAARTLSQTTLAAQVAKEGHPESVLTAEEFDYVNPLNPTDKISTGWTLLIYGQAGDDTDSINEAIQAYIAANSSHTEAEWRAIFPDIYKTTEFSIFPRWHVYAIPERVNEAGRYSSVMYLNKELSYLKANLPEMPEAHINAHASVLPCNYKSLALLVLGGMDNRNSLFDITQVYPDLLNIPTSDTLFESQSEATQEWVLNIQQMLMTAESFTTYSDLPAGFRKVVRAGVVYISAKCAKVHYHVATKATTPAY